MIYLALFVGAVVLFFGFLGLTALESRRGARVLAPLRSTLDAKMARVENALQHVDFSAFLWHLARDVGSRIVHDVAHVILIIVRSLERGLTRIVRYLRSTVHTAPRVEGRRSAFVETITYFKKTLRRSKKATTEEQV